MRELLPNCIIRFYHTALPLFALFFMLLCNISKKSR